MQIDLSSVENEAQLHALLAEKLNFPDFYGNNWDAFYDAITGLVELPREIIFVGSSSIITILPNSVAQMKKIFHDMSQAHPEIECTVKWG